MSVWHHVTDEQSGYLFSLSDSLRIIEEKYPKLLHPVTSGSMIIASDYSGQHKEASHEAYSFLITTSHSVEKWLPLLKVFRDRWLPDGRRISFKKLNEPVRWRALPAFLETAGNLDGNLITILIDRRVGSFIHGGAEAAIRTFPDCFSVREKHGTVEKMLRLANFVALILAGLRGEDQESNWISDHDETLDSHDKREQFGRLASYMTFALTRWKQPAIHHFGTTESPMAPDWSEDLAAIADITAGAYCKMSKYLPSFLGMRTWVVGRNSSKLENHRARAIGHWLGASENNLRHVLLRLELDNNGVVRASAQAFVRQL